MLVSVQIFMMLVSEEMDSNIFSVIQVVVIAKHYKANVYEPCYETCL